MVKYSLCLEMLSRLKIVMVSYWIWPLLGSRNPIWNPLMEKWSEGECQMSFHPETRDNNGLAHLDDLSPRTTYQSRQEFSHIYHNITLKLTMSIKMWNWVFTFTSMSDMSMSMSYLKSWNPLRCVQHVQSSSRPCPSRPCPPCSSQVPQLYCIQLGLQYPKNS